MLQQTRVNAVADHYTRFMERFPTLAALAKASEDDVLACWSGLGYYRRARMLHRAARFVAQELRGRLPKTALELPTLPGIGEYTSAAIGRWRGNQYREHRGSAMGIVISPPSHSASLIPGGEPLGVDIERTDRSLAVMEPGKIRAGTPSAVAPAGTSLITTEFAPILACAPILMGPKTFAPAPISTWPAISGKPLPLSLFVIVTC
jgi:hypothetical protein